MALNHRIILEADRLSFIQCDLKQHDLELTDVSDLVGLVYDRAKWRNMLTYDF